MYCSRNSGLSFVRYTLRCMDSCAGQELPNVVDPVIWIQFRHLFKIAVAVPNTADLHSRAPASLHVRSRIANQQTILGSHP